MILSRLDLECWGPYDGQQSIDLGATYYGVESRRFDDDSRSNAGGKTMLLESIPWAVWGWLNPERGFGVDGFITDGRKKGAVQVTFDDGWWVRRERDEGLSKEKERVTVASGAIGDEAVREAEQRLGLSRDDFFAARFLRQRQAARFVLARPEERMSVVGGWLGLEKLTEAEKIAGTEVAAAEKLVEAKSRVLEVARALAAQTESVEELEKLLSGARTDLDEHRAVGAESITRGAMAREKRAAAAAAASSARRYEEVVGQGIRIRALVDEVDEGALAAALTAAEGEYERASAEHELAKRVIAEREPLARGRFDGRCPLAGIECPARDQINADSERNRGRLAEARRLAETALSARTDSGGRVTPLASRLDRLRINKQSLARLREEATRLKPLAEQGSPSEEEVAAWEEDEREALQTVAEQVRLERDGERLEERLGAARRADEGVTRAEGELAQAERRARVAREGLAVFKASRRRIAESALGSIEAGANEGLAVLGGPPFSLSWSRPGSGLAKTCGGCGEPFSRGERQKACARCGEARGPTRVERLDVVFEGQQSGGIEDLTGCFLSLAAGAWLAADRGSPFATTFLDEVTSHLDVAHRRSFSRKLPAILGRMGVLQSFTVSHDRQVTESFPSRLLVESDGRRSTVRVIA